MALVWADTYLTGEEKIDRQHKKLFECVNKLEAQLQQPTIDASAIEAVLQYLSTYTKTHFVYEEFCMHRVHCPTAQKNQEAHDKFLELFQAVQARYKQEGASRPLVEYLYDAAAKWLVNHICKIDSHLRGCLPV